MDDAERRGRFETLFEEYFRVVLGYAMRRVPDRTVAADIAADTFLVAWRRLDDVPPGPEARLWLYGTARRVLSNHYRSERRRSNLVEKIGARLANLAPATDETSLHVQSALSRLSDDDAELLRLTAWEGVTPHELAAMWDIPAPTVRSRLHRARLRLRQALDGERSAPTGHVTRDGRVPVRDLEERS